MSKHLEKIKQFKGKTKQQYEQFIYENSKKSVIEYLKNSGIKLDEVEPEEFEELLGEEVEKQHEYAKGMATGIAGLALILEIM